MTLGISYTALVCVLVLVSILLFLVALFFLVAVIDSCIVNLFCNFVNSQSNCFTETRSVYVVKLWLEPELEVTRRPLIFGLNLIYFLGKIVNVYSNKELRFILAYAYTPVCR